MFFIIKRWHRRYRGLKKGRCWLRALRLLPPLFLTPRALAQLYCLRQGNQIHSCAWLLPSPHRVTLFLNLQPSSRLCLLTEVEMHLTALRMAAFPRDFIGVTDRSSIYIQTTDSGSASFGTRLAGNVGLPQIRIRETTELTNHRSNKEDLCSKMSGRILSEVRWSAI